MKRKLNTSLKIILIIFFAFFLLSSTTQAKEQYGISFSGSRDLPGGDYSQFNIHSVEQCLKRCADEKKCAAFSFNLTSQSCRLKYYIPRAVSALGIVSGHKLASVKYNKEGPGYPTPVPGKPTIEILSNTDLPGNDFHQTRVGNVKKCAQTCKEDSRCRAFTYNNRTKICWLKNRVPAKRKSSAHISGLKKSEDGNINPPDTNTPNMEMMQKTDLTGSDFHHTQTENATKCAHICIEDSQCKAFTFNIVKKTCWLKNRIPEKRRSSVHISGRKSNPDMKIMRKTVVPGGDYQQIYLENAKECSQVCSKDENCDAFTYVKAFRICKLKSFQPKPIRKKGNISGIKR